jgi:hypothetical protein
MLVVEGLVSLRTVPVPDRAPVHPSFHPLRHGHGHLRHPIFLFTFYAERKCEQRLAAFPHFVGVARECTDLRWFGWYRLLRSLAPSIPWTDRVGFVEEFRLVGIATVPTIGDRRNHRWLCSMLLSSSSLSPRPPLTRLSDTSVGCPNSGGCRLIAAAGTHWRYRLHPRDTTAVLVCRRRRTRFNLSVDCISLPFSFRLSRCLQHSIPSSVNWGNFLVQVIHLYRSIFASLPMCAILRC